MEEFGTRLRNLRTGLNLTQDEAAAEINVSKQAISKWENGHGLPDISSLSALAGLYGTTIDYLLTGEEKVRVEEKIEVVEIEKEKIVEVEKPLSKESQTALLNHYQRTILSSYGWVGFSPLYFAMGCWMISIYSKAVSNKVSDKYSVFLILGIFVMLFSVVIFIWGLRRIPKCKEVKKEIEEKTGKEIGFWGYKD